MKSCMHCKSLKLGCDRNRPTCTRYKKSKLDCSWRPDQLVNVGENCVDDISGNAAPLMGSVCAQITMSNLNDIGM